MDGDVLLSWRFQNVAFIVVVALGLILLIGGSAHLVRRFTGDE